RLVDLSVGTDGDAEHAAVLSTEVVRIRETASPLPDVAAGGGEPLDPATAAVARAEHVSARARRDAVGTGELPVPAAKVTMRGMAGTPRRQGWRAQGREGRHSRRNGGNDQFRAWTLAGRHEQAV